MSTSTANKVSVYVVAHQDDWQLFMNPEASRDIGDSSLRTVIIHTTAGDAGNGRPYWEARENASIESVLLRLSDGRKITRKDRFAGFNGKTIRLTEINNSVLYFLRLPDGAYEGNGFPEYGWQSLEKFRTGGQSRMLTVDGVDEYRSWAELVATLDSVIGYETHRITGDSAPMELSLSFPEPEASLNPDDHNDHFNTALLLQSTTVYSTSRNRAFVHYHIRDYDDLLEGADLFWKVGMFSVYTQSLFKEYGHSTLAEDASFIPWCLLNSRYREL